MTIYVALLGEGVDVWRPVLARPVGESVFEIVNQPYDRDAERWEFEPGERVVCVNKELEGKNVPVATKHA